MYTTAKIAALCAHLLAHQQAHQEVFNRFAFYSRDMPMYVVKLSPVAVNARNAQLQYEKYCE